MSLFINSRGHRMIGGCGVGSSLLPQPQARRRRRRGIRIATADVPSAIDANVRTAWRTLTPVERSALVSLVVVFTEWNVPTWRAIAGIVAPPRLVRR